MKINGKHYLLLERRGCEFFKGDDVKELSDVGNYRVCTPDEMIVANNGKTYFFEFSHYERYNYRKVSKKGNRPLKHPIKELVNPNALHISTQFSNPQGCFADLVLETEFYNKNYSYTEADILTVINSVSRTQFDAIKYVETITVSIPINQNYTAAQLMYKYAKTHNLKTTYYYDTLTIDLYCGKYKYLCFHKKTVYADHEDITLILERVDK